MTAQRKLYAEVRLRGDFAGVWVKHSWWTNVSAAVDAMRTTWASKDADNAPVFVSIRVRFRGYTLERRTR